MKKFLLGALFPGDELDIVNQQDVHGAETVSKTDHAIKAERIDHLVGELLGADVSEPEAWIARLHHMADRLHQVCFPHPHPAIEIKGVISPRRSFGHRPRRRVRELIGPADDKRVERVSQIELMIDAVEIETRLFDRRCCARRRRLRLAANEIELHVRHAHFYQHRLQQFAVSLSQALSKGPRRDPNDYSAVIGPLLLRRKEPSGKAVRINPPFHMLENFFPGVHVLKAANRQAWYFHSMWKCCGNTAQRQPTNLNVSSLGLQPSCSPDLPVSRGRPGVSQDLRVIPPTRSDCPRKLMRAAREKSRITQGKLHRRCTGFPQTQRVQLRPERKLLGSHLSQFPVIFILAPPSARRVRKRLCKRCGRFATTVQSFLARDPAVPIFHRPRTIFSGSSTRYSA